MFTSKVLKLFRETFGPWVTTAPPRPKPRPTFVPRLECLEERWCPATVNMYWDPSSGNNASTVANWDVGSLNGMHNATAAPGNTAGETDNIYFDGTAGRGGNASCTWDYTPAKNNPLGSLTFQNGWNQSLAFTANNGFSVSNTSTVSSASSPTLAPQGGAGATAAITLTNGDLFNIDTGCKLSLTGNSAGDTIFFASGDQKAGEYLYNGGMVVYAGNSEDGVDYVKIPVRNDSVGVFQVNGKGYGATLQVSGTDAQTSNVSFYQKSANAQTDLSNGGTLWCVNNFRMDAGVLQTTNSNNGVLKVGTSGDSPVDGTVYLLGGSVKIYPNGFGKMQIDGTTGADVPIVDAGSVTFNLNVDLSNGSNRSQLTVGRGGGTGKVVFGYNGGTTTIAITPLNSGTANKWTVLYFGSVEGTKNVQFSPNTYSPKWNAQNLEIDLG